MEVLSGVSSGFAVVSLALQLAEKVTKIHDFWRSVRDAPDELGSIAAELEFLERVYIGIAHNAQRETIDPILTKALEDGQQEVTRFEALVSPLRKRCETESRIKRKWASLVAGVWRKEEVAEFRNSISRTKSTLLMALQASARHQSVSDSANQTRMLATLADNSTSLGTGQRDIEVAIGDLSQKTGFLSLELTSHFSSLSSQSSDIRYIKEQLAGMESLIARMARGFPEAVRVQLVDDMNHEVQELSKDGLFSRNASSTDSLPLSGVNRSDSNTLEAFTQSEVDRRENTSSIAYRALSRHHCRKTVFGTFNIRLRMSAMYQSANPQADRTSYTISFHPAHWLIWCGVRYGIELSLLQSMSGWTRRLEPLRMVSRDAVVFELCRDGNIGAVRTLIAKGEASARDTAPHGFTPLIMAAYYGRFELCEYLISAGAETYVNSARPISLPLIYYLIGVSYLRTCIDLKFFRLFDDYLEGILEINFHIDFLIGTLFQYSLRRTTTFAVSDLFCDSLCELLRQYRVTFRQILQHSDDSMRQCILNFSARCSFGAFQDILSLDETLIETMSDTSSILHFLAESEWDESELTARLLFLRNRGVDLLSVSEKYHAPLLRAVRNPNWLRTWVASLRNCGKSFQEIGVAVHWDAFQALLVGSRYRNLCPSQEHECGFGSNSILHDAVEIEYLNMEGGAEADDEYQDTNDEDWETEYEDGQSDDEDEWKPGEWICWECYERCRDSKSEVAEDTELKIPGSFVD
ncbi:hypothetical protein CH63R_12534 [Colletotrichum higginsianum IMI 349063]|uniref:Azaphilone pigments biosynthesis cluster protein L N-terminal domain-containing protein n=2 Tax=Colletotrichum higginsianum (strain IMI 349063) TaxID=759273 RepID=A0A1B7XUG4_COLHI|nr:hypothetical protein CH63R_12534 [Colletotrichum higginsianum IMI 349063]OBR03407.1 hypothetical protein CH63R_12534 [Colletotrichum higginsianum IMI 349063]